jgi:hypothetical protein
VLRLVTALSLIYRSSAGLIPVNQTTSHLASFLFSTTISARISARHVSSLRRYPQSWDESQHSESGRLFSFRLYTFEQLEERTVNRENHLTVGID